MVSFFRGEIFLTLIAGAVGGGIVAAGNYFITDREMNVKMVEIAVGILSLEPKDGILPARDWAVDVIDHHASVKLSPEVRKALIEFKAVVGSTAISTGYTYTPGSTSGYEYTTPPPPN